MLELSVKTLLAYLLGALLGSLVLGRLRGVDIRRAGSGNAGATNALRTQGKLFALSVLVIDIGKGVLAVLYLPHASLPGVALDPEIPRAWLTLACGFAVIVGHVYPVWFGFRGGKGVATMIGVVGALDPRLLLPVLGKLVRRARAHRIRGSREHARGRRAHRFRVLPGAGQHGSAVLFVWRSSSSWSSPIAGTSRACAPATSIACNGYGCSAPARRRPAAPAARVARDGRAALGQLARAMRSTPPESEIAAGIEQLRALGIDIAASPRGFRLKEGQRLELLDADAIRAALRAEADGPAAPAGGAVRGRFHQYAAARTPGAARGLRRRRARGAAARGPGTAGAALDIALRREPRAVARLDISRCRARRFDLEPGRGRGRLPRARRTRRAGHPSEVAERCLVRGPKNRRCPGRDQGCGGGTAHVVVGIGLNLHLSDESRRQIGAGGLGLAALDDGMSRRPSRATLSRRRSWRSF